MLALAEANKAQAGATNVEFLKGTIEGVPLPETAVDVVISPTQRADRGSYVDCIAGALSQTEYIEGLAAVGFVDPEVTYTHEAAPQMHSAIIRATKLVTSGTA